MVPRAGVEPARCCHRGIFVPTTAFTARMKRFVVWTFSLPYHVSRVRDVGRSRQVSTLS